MNWHWEPPQTGRQDAAETVVAGAFALMKLKYRHINVRRPYLLADEMQHKDAFSPQSGGAANCATSATTHIILWPFDTKRTGLQRIAAVAGRLQAGDFQIDEMPSLRGVVVALAAIGVAGRPRLLSSKTPPNVSPSADPTKMERRNVPR